MAAPALPIDKAAWRDRHREPLATSGIGATRRADTWHARRQMYFSADESERKPVRRCRPPAYRAPACRPAPPAARGEESNIRRRPLIDGASPMSARVMKSYAENRRKISPSEDRRRETGNPSSMSSSKRACETKEAKWPIFGPKRRAAPKARAELSWPAELIRSPNGGSQKRLRERRRIYRRRRYLGAQ